MLAILDWGKPGHAWALAGSALYLIGCMLVTIRCNVPLNDKLAAIEPTHEGSAAEWKQYVARWMPWNHVRTLATIGALLAFVFALKAAH